MKTKLSLIGIGLGTLVIGYIAFSKTLERPVREAELDTSLELKFEEPGRKIITHSYEQNGTKFQENYVVEGRTLVGDSIVIDHYEKCIRETARQLPGGRSTTCLQGDRLTVYIFPAQQPWRPTRVLEGKVTDSKLNYYAQRYAINQALLEESGL
jgi:hypothetical protein